MKLRIVNRIIRIINIIYNNRKLIKYQPFSLKLWILKINIIKLDGLRIYVRN